MDYSNKITVTSPLLPNLDDFYKYLEKIWHNRCVTNGGNFHQQFEFELSQYLKVKHISLFTNGTIPLMTALHALNITGEVITTPYSFVATSNVLVWNNITPVFIDIDPSSGCMNPNLIEAAITEKTSAILPVHVYGNPADTKAIKAIADKYNLKTIYDAAHAFGVEIKDENSGLMQSILTQGDISTISFHATKVFNTIEGGAIICGNSTTKQQIDRLKNFGYTGETSVADFGINGKLDEIRSAYGLLNLQQIDSALLYRKKIANLYRYELSTINGISMFDEFVGIKPNYSHFPIFIDKSKFGISRDELYATMCNAGIFARRYFYPLISNFDIYKKYKSSSPDILPIANKFANTVICLPIHNNLTINDITKIINLIKKSACSKIF